MPSTLVHAALGALVATALLGRAFRLRTVLVVVAAVILVDFDVFVGMAVTGAHRAAFHTLLLPGLAAVALACDARLRDRSLLADRFGPDAPRTAAVTVVAVVLAGIGPDLMTNGANLLYPLHDQFYALDGRIQLSDQRGVVQTFLEEPAKGSSEETQYYTGADPNPSEGGAETDENVERTFMVVNSGLELLLVVSGIAITTARLWEVRAGNAAHGVVAGESGPAGDPDDGETDAGTAPAEDPSTDGGEDPGGSDTE